MYVTYSELLRLGRFGKISRNGIYYTERGIYVGVTNTTARLYLTSEITGENTGDQLVFKNIAVSGQDTVIATDTNDTLTLAAGSNVTITTDDTNRTITIASSGGGGGGVSDGDKGDITVSGSGTTWTIDNSTISLAKMANVATSTVFYRKTAGTGAPEVQTLATLKTDLGLTGTNSGDQTTISGNAGTATALQTARNIQGVSFDGTADINPISGTGFVKVSGTTLSYDNSTYLTTATAASTYAPIASPTFTGTVSGITKSMVGLGNVVNADTTTTANITDSLNKRFITDAQQTILGNTSNTNTGDQLTFKTITVSGQPNIVATSGADTLTVKAGTNITLTNDATTREITISAGGGVSDGTYGDVTVSGGGSSWAVTKINGTSLAGLGTGILKNTTGTGVPSIAVAGDFPTLNQNTTGSAATLTTARTIGGVSFNGSANITVATATGGFTVTGGELVAPACTTTTSCINFPTGTLETTVEQGDMEFDGTNFYLTTDTTNGRGYLQVVNQFRLTSTLAPIGPAISDYFGGASSIPLVNGGYYEIEIEVYFLKTTAGTVTWTLTNTAAPTSQNIYFMMSPATGIVAPAPGSAGNLDGNYYNDTTAARAFTATASLTTAVNHYAYFRIILRNGAGTSLRLRATCSAGTITPGIGSRWKATRLPATNTGTYAA